MCDKTAEQLVRERCSDCLSVDVYEQFNGEPGFQVASCKPDRARFAWVIHGKSTVSKEDAWEAAERNTRPAEPVQQEIYPDMGLNLLAKLKPFCTKTQGCQYIDGHKGRCRTWDSTVGQARSMAALITTQGDISLLSMVREHMRLAEEKIDQTLQGQGPAHIRLGVALETLRQGLNKIDSFMAQRKEKVPE